MKPLKLPPLRTVELVRFSGDSDVDGELAVGAGHGGETLVAGLYKRARERLAGDAVDDRPMEMVDSVTLARGLHAEQVAGRSGEEQSSRKSGLPGGRKIAAESAWSPSALYLRRYTCRDER